MAGNPQHVILPGSHAAYLFAEADYAAYVHWRHESAQRYGVAIHVYCVVTTNHGNKCAS